MPGSEAAGTTPGRAAARCRRRWSATRCTRPSSVPCSLSSPPPDLYLVRVKSEELATLESLATGAEASLPCMPSTPAPELGEVLPLRSWKYGKSGLWLPAGKSLSRVDAQALLERIRARFGSTDAGAMRSAAALILRETFVL